VLHTDSPSIKVLPVEILDNVLSVTAILKLSESKPLLDRDVPDSSIALEELLNIPAATMTCPETVPCPFRP